MLKSETSAKQAKTAKTQKTTKTTKTKIAEKLLLGKIIISN